MSQTRRKPIYRRRGFRSEDQRKATFANLANRAIRRPYGEDARAFVGGASAALALGALRAMRHPIGKGLITIGKIRLIGKSYGMLRNTATRSASWLVQKKRLRDLKNIRTIPVGEGVYIKKPRFPKLRKPWNPPREGSMFSVEW